MDVFTVPESHGNKKENRFPFQSHKGGKVFTVPFLQYLSGASAELIDEHMDDWEEARLTRAVICLENPAAAETMRRMANDQVRKLAKAWAAASQSSLGESSGSGDS